MHNRPTLRRTQQKARELAKAYESMRSFPKVAKAFNITTPSGLLNPRLVKHLIDGYRPRHEDTLKRCGLLDAPTPIIHNEPIHRVLIGAWRLAGRWVSPEEYFGARV